MRWLHCLELHPPYRVLHVFFFSSCIKISLWSLTAHSLPTGAINNVAAVWAKAALRQSASLNRVFLSSVLVLRWQALVYFGHKQKARCGMRVRREVRSDLYMMCKCALMAFDILSFLFFCFFKFTNSDYCYCLNMLVWSTWRVRVTRWYGAGGRCVFGSASCLQSWLLQELWGREINNW